MEFNSGFKGLTPTLFWQSRETADVSCRMCVGLRHTAVYTDKQLVSEHTGSEVRMAFGNRRICRSTGRLVLQQD